MFVQGVHFFVVGIHSINERVQMYIKKAPDKDEGNLMFSQRNNPYCELLSNSMQMYS